MKIAIVAPSPKPFIVGGAEKLFMGMLFNFNKITNHNIELIKIPVKDQDFWELIKGYYNFYKLDLSHFDMVISTKYPAWMLKHPNHIVYMQHTCRGVYDLYTGEIDYTSIIRKNKKYLSKLQFLLTNDSTKIENLFEELFYINFNLSNISSDAFEFPNPLTRAIIHKLDNLAFKNIKKFFAISKNVASRNYYPNNVNVKVVYHPSSLENLFSNDYKYIFTVSRLEKLKRIDLLIKAFKQTSYNIDFLIAGTGGEEKYLKSLAKDDNRIKFLGFVSDEEIIDYYSNALFIPYIPYDEDYGLITIEAMNASKAVLTTVDSGGVNEFVKNEYNGIVTFPNVKSLKEAFDKLLSNKNKTIEMGKNAKKSVDFITWKYLAKNLFNKEPLPKLLLLNTFSIQNQVSGGAKRIFNLYKNLTDEYEINLITLGSVNKKIKLFDNFFEVQVAKTKEFIKKEDELENILKVPATDIAFMKYYYLIPEYEYFVKKYLIDSKYIILEHPYVYPIFKSLHYGFKTNYIHSSHNIEYLLKSYMFHNKEILNFIYKIEKECFQNSIFSFVCTYEDKTFVEENYNFSKLAVIENGIDISNFSSLKRNPKNIAIFVGSYHKPNIEAVEFIIEIAKLLKDYQFVIIGSVKEAFKRKGIPSNIYFTGVISEEEKISFYEQAYIALNPIFSGGGSNLKILEYISAKIPVLTTSLGIRGYKSIEGVAIFNSKNDFIEKFLKISYYSNVERAFKSIQYYDWINISNKLKKYLTKQ